MSFTAPRFTNEGKALQAKAQAGTALKFTKMQLGDGELGSQAIAAMTGLVNPLITVGISDVKAGNNYATVKSNFSNSGLTTGFYWREIGVFAADPEKPNDRNSDILYCYANAGSLAEYIPAAGSAIVEKIISIPCIIGDAENVSAEVESEIYATKEALKEHIDNKNNPHKVTAKQLGALTDESLTKEKILNKIDVLDIAHGGTGKATRKEAFDNLAFLGYNPISSPDEDTPQKWCELGNGYAWFYTDGLMINQPYLYMFVISYHNETGDVFQIGCEQKSGSLYYRNSNPSSWYTNWTPLLSINSGMDAGIRKKALDSLTFLGYNPISSPDEDTTKKWRELGGGYAWFNTDGLMVNQPCTFMFVINYTTSNINDNDVFQIGSAHAYGETLYYRTGNELGWHVNWTPLLSTKGGTMSGPIHMNNQSIVCNKDADYDNGNWFSITGASNCISFDIRHNGKSRVFNFNDNTQKIDQALQMWWYDDGKEHSSRFFGEHNTSLLATTIQNLMQEGSISAVRSVQRGTANLSNDSEPTTSVNISSVNTDKSVLLIDGQNDISGNTSSNNASGKIKDSTTLEFTPTNARSKNVINWKVVEYY